MGKERRHTAYAQAPPLPLASISRALNRNANLLSSLVHVLNNFLALHLNVRDSRFLLHNQCLHILEQLSELNHLLLNLLDSLVSVLHSVKSRSALASSIALEQSLREDLLVRGILHSLANFSFRSIWSNNAVLASHLLLQPLSERGVHGLVFLDCSLKLTVNFAKLRCILGRSGLALLLDRFDSASEVAVHGHRLGGNGIELSVGLAVGGGIGVIERALLKLGKVSEVLFDRVDAFVDFTQLVENCIGISSSLRGVAGSAC